ncbi:metalloprotease, partial [Candidatus Omnitrophota bacterium]
MPRRGLKIVSLILSVLLLAQQSGFAQAAGELDLAGHLMGLQGSLFGGKFRPLHLRYLSHNPQTNDFKLLLDRGDNNGLTKKFLKDSTRELLDYVLIGIALPNESFWVNLRPDSPDQIVDQHLGRTDIGRIFLEADLQLKKDTASFTSPKTKEGSAYWGRLYEKAGELFGSENISIPTLTRPWIVPGEIIIRETTDSAYVYKASLKVMLEQDYLEGSATYSFEDPRLKELNDYSSELIRELILPKLTQKINTSEEYAPLRQVYYSLIIAQWFKQRFRGRGGLHSWKIDRGDLTGLVSERRWSKDTYFKAYQASFKDGEYNLQEPVQTLQGQAIRSYFSGGMNLALAGIPITHGPGTSATNGAVTVVGAGAGQVPGAYHCGVDVNDAGTIVTRMPEVKEASIDTAEQAWAREGVGQVQAEIKSPKPKSKTSFSNRLLAGIVGLAVLPGLVNLAQAADSGIEQVARIALVISALILGAVLIAGSSVATATLLHEGAHALTAKMLGAENIKFGFWMVLSKFRFPAQEREKYEVRLALSAAAGPFANLIAGPLTLLPALSMLKADHGFASALLGMGLLSFSIASVGIGIANLIPFAVDKEGHPSDGKQIWDFLVRRVRRRQPLKASSSGQTSKDLASVQTFDELYDLIRSVEEVHGSQRDYGPKELIAAIRAVRAGGLELRSITRARGTPLEGLRSKVAELIFSVGRERTRAEKLLGRKVTDSEWDAIQRAHLVGAAAGHDYEIGPDGRPRKHSDSTKAYTAEEIAQKARILAEAGFSQEERRKLIEGGIAGEEPPARESKPSLPEKTPKPPSPRVIIPALVRPKLLVPQGVLRDLGIKGIRPNRAGLFVPVEEPPPDTTRIEQEIKRQPPEQRILLNETDLDILTKAGESINDNSQQVRLEADLFNAFIVNFLVHLGKLDINHPICKELKGLPQEQLFPALIVYAREDGALADIRNALEYLLYPECLFRFRKEELLGILAGLEQFIKEELNRGLKPKTHHLIELLLLLTGSKEVAEGPREKASELLLSYAEANTFAESMRRQRQPLPYRLQERLSGLFVKEIEQYKDMLVNLRGLSEEERQVLFRRISRVNFGYSPTGLSSLPAGLTFGLEFEIALTDPNGKPYVNEGLKQSLMAALKEAAPGWGLTVEANYCIELRSPILKNQAESWSEIQGVIAALNQLIKQDYPNLRFGNCHLHIGLEPAGIKDKQHKTFLLRLASYSKRLILSLMRAKEVKRFHDFSTDVLVKGGDIATSHRTWINFSERYPTVELKAMAVPTDHYAGSGTLDSSLLQAQIAIALGLVVTAAQQPDEHTITRLGLPLKANSDDYCRGLDMLYKDNYLIKAMAIWVLERLPVRLPADYSDEQANIYWQNDLIALIRELHSQQGGQDTNILQALQGLIDGVAKQSGHPKYQQLERFLCGLYYIFYGNENEREFARAGLKRINSKLFLKISNLAGQFRDDVARNYFLEYTAPATLRASANRSGEEIIPILTKIFNLAGQSTGDPARNYFLRSTAPATLEASANRSEEEIIFILTK